MRHVTVLDVWKINSVGISNTINFYRYAFEVHKVFCYTTVFNEWNYENIRNIIYRYIRTETKGMFVDFLLIFGWPIGGISHVNTNCTLDFATMKLIYKVMKSFHGGGTPYESQKWASVKMIILLHQMWSITPDVTGKIGRSQGKFSSF
jgi:hypothetical protein